MDGGDEEEDDEEGGMVVEDDDDEDELADVVDIDAELIVDEDSDLIGCVWLCCLMLFDSFVIDRVELVALSLVEEDEMSMLDWRAEAFSFNAIIRSSPITLVG